MVPIVPVREKSTARALPASRLYQLFAFGRPAPTQHGGQLVPQSQQNWVQRPHCTRCISPARDDAQLHSRVRLPPDIRHHHHKLATQVIDAEADGTDKSICPVAFPSISAASTASPLPTSMLFDSCVHKSSASTASASSMGHKFSRDHSPTASFHHSSRRHANATVPTHPAAAVNRISIGRVSTSYAPHSPTAPHDDRLRRTGRRKLVHRGKAHSDPHPGLDKSGLTTSPTNSNYNPHARLSSRVQAYDHAFHATTRPTAKSDDACCSKCARAGMEWDKYRPSAVVKDYAAVSTQNSKFRKHMEDECVVIPKFKAYHGDPAKSSFFGVYDGHGGSFCARYAAKNFHSRLSASMAGRIGTKLRESDIGSRPSLVTSSGSTACSENDDLLSVEDIEACYAEACAALDQELASYDESAACGSTAVTCLIRNFNGRTSFHVANVGDSRAILFANGTTSRLTVDHKATNADEVKRIRARDGIILNKRVGGVISVTRAFGQTDEKQFITSDPHTKSGEVQSNNSFLVLASDGVTDVFSDDEITEFVSERLARGEKSITICKSLLDEAKAQGAMDNMTTVLICFSDLE